MWRASLPPSLCGLERCALSFSSCSQVSGCCGCGCHHHHPLLHLSRCSRRALHECTRPIPFLSNSLLPPPPPPPPPFPPCAQSTAPHVMRNIGAFAFLKAATAHPHLRAAGGRFLRPRRPGQDARNAPPRPPCCSFSCRQRVHVHPSTCRGMDLSRLPRPGSGHAGEDTQREREREICIHRSQSALRRILTSSGLGSRWVAATMQHSTHTRYTLKQAI